MNIYIIGVSEIKWTGLGKIQKEQHTILYSGGDNHTRGVGIIINYSAAVIDGINTNSRIYVGDSIVTILSKGEDVVVCLPGAQE